MNPTLIACTKVSRMFWVASRGRIFSRLTFAPAGTVEGTKTKLEGLAELLEDDPNLLRTTSCVEVYDGYWHNTQWTLACDGVLDRILSLIIARPQTIHYLKIKCVRSLDFETALGRRTQEDILQLVAGLQKLSLEHMEIPVAFFDRRLSLKFMRLIKIRLKSSTDMVHVPPPAFYPDAEIETDRDTLEQLHDLYSRSRQPLPAYTILKYKENFRGVSGGEMYRILDGSQNTLTRLKMLVSMVIPSNLVAHQLMQSTVQPYTITKLLHRFWTTQKANQLSYSHALRLLSEDHCGSYQFHEKVCR